MLSLVLAALLAAPAMDTGSTEAPAGALGDAVLATPLARVRPFVRTDPRFAALDPLERAALLEGLREPWRAEASLVNLFPGFGIGSFMTGDTWGGGWLLAFDAASTGVLFAGVMDQLEASTRFDPAERQRSTGTRPLLITGLAAIGVGRVLGVVVPMRFGGRRHAAVAGALRALDSAAEKQERRSVQLGLAPLAGPGARGAVVSLRF